MLSTYCVIITTSADFSKDFLTKSDLLKPDLVIAACICFASTGVNRAEMKTPLAFCVPSFGRPIIFFMLFV